MQARVPIRRAFLTQDNRLALFWRLLSYLFFFVVVNFLASVVRSVLESVGLPLVLSQLVFTLLYISGILGLTYVYRRSIDRRSWQGIALLPLNKHLLAVTVGAVCGILIVALVFGLEYVAGWIQIVGSEEGTSAALFLVESLILSLAFGVCEEICFRGYIFQNLGESSPIWLATLLTGLIFGAFHLLEVGVGLRGFSFLLFILLLNMFLVLARLLTRSLWLAIGFHAAFDWMAINVGLGAVVLADGHLLHVARMTSVIAEDLLSAFVVLLGVLLLLVWPWRGRQRIPWRGTLTEDGQPQALEAPPVPALQEE